MTRNKKATEAFITEKQTISALLARLSTLSDNYFDRHPDEISWGDVGDLRYWGDQLHAVTDSAFHEGECSTS